MTATQPRRSLCTVCLRAQTACICRWVTPIVQSPDVLILQHPLEARQAKGSARLLHLSLPGSRLVIGETFAPAELQTLLYATACHPAAQDVADSRLGICPLLLYPDDPASIDATDGCMSSVPALPDPTTRRRLVVIDGTWRKSRKMLALNPLLQALPRLALRNPPPSRYRIRKRHRDDQLSTLEATCHALMQLDKDADKYLPLLQAFDRFVAQQAAYRQDGGTQSDGSSRAGKHADEFEASQTGQG